MRNLPVGMPAKSTVCKKVDTSSVLRANNCGCKVLTLSGNAGVTGATS